MLVKIKRFMSLVLSPLMLASMIVAAAAPAVAAADKCGTVSKSVNYTVKSDAVGGVVIGSGRLTIRAYRCYTGGTVSSLSRVDLPTGSETHVNFNPWLYQVSKSTLPFTIPTKYIVTDIWRISLAPGTPSGCIYEMRHTMRLEPDGHYFNHSFTWSRVNNNCTQHITWAFV